MWQRLHEVRLARLNAAGVIDWSRSAADGSHVRALKGGPRPGPARSTGARTGSKHHVITDGGGIPLAVTLTGGNRNDITQLIPLIDAIPAGPRAAPPGPPRAREGIRRPRLRPRQIPGPGQGQGASARSSPAAAPPGTARAWASYRYVVEQAIALLHWFRRLRIRWEMRDDIHEAFLSLGCGIICWRRLANLSLC